MEKLKNTCKIVINIALSLLGVICKVGEVWLFWKLNVHYSLQFRLKQISDALRSTTEKLQNIM